MSTPTPHPNLYHVDVFATRPLSGNGLSVFLHADGWPAPLMQSLTQEMKQFESIFLSDIQPGSASARVFTVEEELPFAGHPVLGAAVVLHRRQTPDAPQGTWLLRLPGGEIEVSTQKHGNGYLAEMNQGIPVCGAPLAARDLQAILARLGLHEADLVQGLPAQVISTGLPYLILPLHAPALARAAINGTDLEALLAKVEAKFVLVLDVAGREIRTWDNLGKVEDVATGSAAGPAAAWLYGHGVVAPDQALVLAQGRFAGRPSQLSVRRDQQQALLVSGEVWPISHGWLDPAVLLAAPR
jgi:PhzF family phenazine biosynthesis protein